MPSEAMTFLPSLSALSLLHPHWLALAALAIPAALLVRRRRGARAALFGPGSFLFEPRPLPSTWRTRLRAVPAVLAAAGLLALAVALARPVERVALPPANEGIDVLLCLDVSSSMAATDLAPDRTRLRVATDAAARFVAARPDDRIGLVTFARYPDVRCPLTLDHEALAAILGEVEMAEPDGAEDATGIGTALARAAQVLRASNAKSKVVVLLSDGEENVATTGAPGTEIAPVHAAQLAREGGVRVYTISAGVGKRSAGGEWQPLDHREAKIVAEATGGRFFEAKDAGALAAVYESIDRLERTRLEETRYRVEERFFPFLASGLLLLLAALALRSSPSALEVLP
jgi:Ca-activated chloride channel family protein